MDDGLKVVGKRLAAVDAFAKVTGRAEYCSNISLPQMLVGKILRSPQRVDIYDKHPGHPGTARPLSNRANRGK